MNGTWHEVLDLVVLLKGKKMERENKNRPASSQVRNTRKGQCMYCTSCIAHKGRNLTLKLPSSHSKIKIWATPPLGSPLFKGKERVQWIHKILQKFKFKKKMDVEKLESDAMDGVSQLQKQLVDYTASLFEEVSI